MAILGSLIFILTLVFNSNFVFAEKCDSVTVNNLLSEGQVLIGAMDNLEPTAKYLNNDGGIMRYRELRVFSKKTFMETFNRFDTAKGEWTTSQIFYLQNKDNTYVEFTTNQWATEMVACSTENSQIEVSWKEGFPTISKVAICSENVEVVAKDATISFTSSGVVMSGKWSAMCWGTDKLSAVYTSVP